MLTPVWIFRIKLKSHGATSGEYSGFSDAGMVCFAHNAFTALPCWRIRYSSCWMFHWKSDEHILCRLLSSQQQLGYSDENIRWSKEELFECFHPCFRWTFVQTSIVLGNKMKLTVIMSFYAFPTQGWCRQVELFYQRTCGQLSLTFLY